MKKIRILIVLLLLVFVTIGCGKGKEENEEETKVVKVLMPEGIPAVALGGLFEDKELDITVVSGPSVLSSELIKDEYDVIVAPIILGAQLYTKGSLKYKLNSVLTMGNSFLVCKKEKSVESLKDLEGKKIAAYGQNTAPDIVLKAALEAKGVDVTKIEFVYENSVQDVLTNRLIADSTVDYILCAEPVISKIEISLKAKVGEISKIDLQNELKDELSLIPQAGIFVNKELDDKTIQKLSNKVKDNVSYLNTNTEAYVDKLMAYKGDYSYIFENLGKDVIVNSVPNSSIVCLNAKENIETLNKYFSMINKFNSKILNNNTIDENFY